MRPIWRISPEIKQQIRHLPPELKRKIWEAIDEIYKKHEAGKPLEEELTGYRTYRVGRYRLIYRIAGDRLVLEAFGSRRDIYERFVLEIGRQKIRERTAKYNLRKLRTKKRSHR